VSIGYAVSVESTSRAVSAVCVVSMVSAVSTASAVNIVSTVSIISDPFRCGQDYHPTKNKRNTKSHPFSVNAIKDLLN
jgi:hypothetical protein